MYPRNLGYFVLEKLSATVLEIAKEHQNGRAEKKSAMADFTDFMLISDLKAI